MSKEKLCFLSRICGHTFNFLPFLASRWAVQLKAQRFVAGKLILKQALTAFHENKTKQAMKFEISGFYSSGDIFKLGGLVSGKVLPFHHGTLSTALIKALTDHAMLNICVV